MTIVSGVHNWAARGLTKSPGKGAISTDQAWPCISSERFPVERLVRSGRAVSTARRVSTSPRCCSILPEPRIFPAMSNPMAAKETAATASATRASMRVNPALASRALPGCSKGIAWNNFDPSRQPSDADFEGSPKPREENCAAAGHSGRKELDCHSGGTPVALARKDCIKSDILWQLHQTPGRTGSDRSGYGAKVRRDGDAAPDGRVAIGLEQGRRLDRVAFEHSPRGSTRKRRQGNGREHGDDGEDTNDLEQGKTGLAPARPHRRSQLLMATAVPVPPSLPDDPRETISYGPCSLGER